MAIVQKKTKNKNWGAGVSLIRKFASLNFYNFWFIFSFCSRPPFVRCNQNAQQLILLSEIPEWRWILKTPRIHSIGIIYVINQLKPWKQKISEIRYQHCSTNHSWKRLYKKSILQIVYQNGIFFDVGTLLTRPEMFGRNSLNVYANSGKNYILLYLTAKIALQNERNQISE